MKKVDFLLNERGEGRMAKVVLRLLFCMMICSLGAITFASPHMEYKPGEATDDLFCIYTNIGGDNHYYASGWMGDGAFGETCMQFNDEWTQNPHSSPTCIQVHYSYANATCTNRWAGIDWQEPEDNWVGDHGQGYNLTEATCLTFWARADAASLPLKVKFWVGYPDDSCHEIVIAGTWVSLYADWRKYRIVLSGDLSDVVNGFGFAVNNTHMTGTQCTFYLDDICFEDSNCLYTPTATPTITRTPTPTNIPLTPTLTPPPPSSTPIATDTPTEPPAHTYTPTVTPSPFVSCTTMGVVQLEIPMTYISPGDTFYCTAYVCNPNQVITPATFVAMLSVGTGDYWFYPSWIQYPPSIDYKSLVLQPGIQTEPVISPFTWPDISDSFGPIYIYSALLNDDFTAVEGDIQYVTFQYGPSKALALHHLAETMDRYHKEFSIYKDDNCGGNHFIPSGWMGDWSDLSYYGSWCENPAEGIHCLRLDYSADEGQGVGWSGIFWQYPDSNWGDEIPYYNLNKAHKVSFKVRCDAGKTAKCEFSIGGLNNPRGYSELPYQDSMIALSTGLIDITPEWTEHVIDLNSAHPFTVYTDKRAGRNNRGFPTGWMGDGEDPEERYLQLDDAWTVAPHSGDTCIRVHYSVGPELWAGIDWQQPEDNWNGDNGYGYDLTGATCLTFWAKADASSPHVNVQFWVGYPQSLEHSPDSCGQRFIPGFWVTLIDEWQEYTIPLSGDLSDIVNLFGFAVNEDSMPGDECTFYLDDIAFDKNVEVNLESMISGFCWTAEKAQNPQGCTIYLDDVKYDFASLDTLHLPVSYVAECTQGTNMDVDIVNGNVCWIYDVSLVMLAFMSRGLPTDWERAIFLADTMIYAQQHDRDYADSRLRNAYRSGDLIDPKTGYALLPGWWDYGSATPTACSTSLYSPTPTITPHWGEDPGAVGTSTGNLAWVMLAFLELYENMQQKVCPQSMLLRDPQPYLLASEALGTWIVTNCYSDSGFGGYTGGVSGWAPEPTVAKWKSTEHNLDIFVAFSRLAPLSSDPFLWELRAQHALEFIERMWNEEDGHFWTGTTYSEPENREFINQDVIPLDPQSWGILALLNFLPYQSALTWAQQNCWVQNHNCPWQPVFSGFDFNSDKDGVWLEGTAQMALAARRSGQGGNADNYLEQIRIAQSYAHNSNGEGIVAACHDFLTTGFYTESGQWYYFNRLHTGATSWYILAENSMNPYWGYVPISGKTLK